MSAHHWVSPREVPGLGPYEQCPALQRAPGSLSKAFLVTRAPSTAATSQGCSGDLPELSAPPWISLALGFPPHTSIQCSGTGGAPTTAASMTEYLHCQPDFKYCTHFLVALSAGFDLLSIKGHLMGGGSFFLLLYLGMVNADARSGDECQPMSDFLYHETYYCHCSPASFGLKIAPYYYYITPDQAFLWTYIQEKNTCLYF